MSDSAAQPGILLVEDSSTLFNEIKSLMGFMGYDTFYVNDLETLAGALNRGEFTAVLLGEFQGESARQKALELIQPGSFPVILVNQDKINLEKYQSQQHQVIAHLEMPLKFEPVSAALAQASELISASDAESLKKQVNSIPKLGAVVQPFSRFV